MSTTEQLAQTAPILPNEPEGPERQRFLNRQLTWLAFNERVLHMAVDERTPLLERVRFLSIFTSNLDEFFMKRVGGLKRQVLAKVNTISIDGMSPAQQVAAIREQSIPMLQRQAELFTSEICPALAERGIEIYKTEQLSEADQAYCDEYFQNRVFPVLTPMAVDPGHPFPLLSNLSVSLGVKMAHPGSQQPLFARVKVPEMLPRWIRLPEEDTTKVPFRFFSLVELIRRHLQSLFPGMELLSSTPFRITRNADVEQEEEDAEDLLEMIEQELRQRRFANIVRLEHGTNADPWTIDFIMHELRLSEQDVFELPAELDYTGLKPIIDLELPELKYPNWSPVTPPRLADEEADIFSVIRSGDLLVHHPYESFTQSVERYVRAAAKDPHVLAIKITLYRVGDSGALMQSLIQAAEAGKQVVCMVEIKASFDEQRNIYWAQQLERAGVHVFYGVVGLKTHTKLALVVRQEAEGIRCYSHIGTGNYNAATARLYTDIGLLTCRPELTLEVVELFHYLTGRSLKDHYEHLLVAPVNMRRRFKELIQQEIEHHRAGRPAGIVAKMNSLEDRQIIEALYEASQAGITVDLIVRGFCCLRPGVPGMSENISVTSVIGRFLEHSRIYYFQAGQAGPGDGEFYIGSADWMHRNLANRVEAITPVANPDGKARLWQVLDVMRQDRRQGWRMHPDGSYTLHQPEDPETELGTHELFMHEAFKQAWAEPHARHGAYE